MINFDSQISQDKQIFRQIALNKFEWCRFFSDESDE